MAQGTTYAKPENYISFTKNPFNGIDVATSESTGTYEEGKRSSLI